LKFLNKGALMRKYLLKTLQKGLFKRLKRDEGGAAAIEFAIVALPFFAIMFATFEVAMIYWAQGVLTEAVEPQARRGMTGELQKTGNLTLQGVRDSICEKAGAMLDCSKFIIDVRTLPDFTQLANRSLLSSGGDIIATQFDFGKRGDIVMMRVGYPWTTIFPFTSGITFDLGNMGNGQRLLQVTSVIRNEKF
jgi:Flp pilus assembly protein TadG